MTYQAVGTRVIGRRLREPPHQGKIYVPLTAREQLDLFKVTSTGDQVTKVRVGQYASFPPDSYYVVDKSKDLIAVLEEDIQFVTEEPDDVLS